MRSRWIRWIRWIPVVALWAAASCSDPAAPEPTLALATDSTVYTFENVFGRTVSVAVTNASGTMVEIATCDGELRAGFDRQQADESWTDPWYYCNGPSESFLLLPGTTVTMRVHIPIVGVFRFRAPILRGGTPRYSTVTSAPVEIR